MAFFKNLKERLLRSSAQLDEGLDEIVSAGNGDTAESGSETAETETERRGLLKKLLGGQQGFSREPRRRLDDEMLESLEDLLISSDMGVDTASRVCAYLSEGRLGKMVATSEIKKLISEEVASLLEPVAKPIPLYAKKPQVILIVGVNGSGKTTTIGKLASQFQASGKKTIIAAGDTFRAAAVDQLRIWGDRANVPVLTAAQGTDPAALAYTALEKAQGDNADLLLIDTAGRLQPRTNRPEFGGQRPAAQYGGRRKQIPVLRRLRTVRIYRQSRRLPEGRPRAGTALRLRGIRRFRKCPDDRHLVARDRDVHGENDGPALLAFDRRRFEARRAGRIDRRHHSQCANRRIGRRRSYGRNLQFPHDRA